MGVLSKIFFNSGDSETKVTFKGDDDSGRYEQHKIERDSGSSKHEHTWSQTTPSSHKEGWHGKDFETQNNK